MHPIPAVLAALFVSGLTAMGVAAIRTGWVLPWGAHKILRPRLWGSGSLVLAVGAALFMSPVASPGLADRFAVLPVVGWAVFLVGLVIQMAARWPGRL
ncbi:hypothetical protein ABZT08_24850 [Streptomyces sp. NPDC005526]|uniref:hypothetical protein n=1 Tax=Streptomyces sp. NPDC005526 TaxID=3156885 RepID=UPI00339E8EE9